MSPQLPRRTLLKALETSPTQGGWGRNGQSCPSFPPASPELIPGSGLREAPAISPLHLPSSKDPFPRLPASPPATELPEYP